MFTRPALAPGARGAVTRPAPSFAPVGPPDGEATATARAKAAAAVTGSPVATPPPRVELTSPNSGIVSHAYSRRAHPC